MEKLTFFERAVRIVDRYGTWRVIQSIFFVGVFLFTIYYIPAMARLSVEKAIDNKNKTEEANHIKNIERRKLMQPKIYSVLETLIHSTNSDRAFIMELHNGSNNINGVPFVHGSVTYEKAREGLECIDEEFQNLSLSRFDMSYYLHSHFNYIGSVDDLSKIDRKLSMKLAANGVKYIAMTTLHNGHNEWGWFGITYTRMDDLPSEKVILNELLIASQSISNILMNN